MTVIMIFFQVVDCGDPTSNITNQLQEFVSGSKPNPTTYSLSTNLKCKIGYRYTDGYAQKSITCQASGSWMSISSCECLLNNIFNSFGIILVFINEYSKGRPEKWENINLLFNYSGVLWRSNRKHYASKSNIRFGVEADHFQLFDIITSPLPSRHEVEW